MDNILHYSVLILMTTVFSVLYFVFLKSNMNKVLNKEKSMGYLYGSFMLRFILSGVFLFFLIRYYNDIKEIGVMLGTFILVRFVFIRKEKLKYSHKKKG